MTGTEPPPPPPGPYPTISCAQARGVEILRADPASRRLLGGIEAAPSEFSEFGVEWYSCDGDQGGTSVTLDLERPLTVEAEWPVLVDECDGKPYRVEFRCHFVENATALTVDVDLDTERVVSITPEGDLRVDGKRPTAGFEELPAGC